MDVISFNYDGSIKLQLLSCRLTSQKGESVGRSWVKTAAVMKQIRDEINAIAINEYANLSSAVATYLAAFHSSSNSSNKHMPQQEEPINRYQIRAFHELPIITQCQASVAHTKHTTHTQTDTHITLAFGEIWVHCSRFALPSFG